MLRTALCVAIAIASIANVAIAEISFRGVSLAGAEFGEGSLPGNFGQHYIYPNAGEVDYFMSRGMNSFRLPFRWERLQRSLGASLNSTELGRMRDFVDYATDQGAHVMLDPHNFARYHGTRIGDAGVPDAQFADFWSRIATEFKDNPNVVFGLMNEPNTMPTEQWLSSANTAIQAIRDTGAKNLIMVPGNAWSGAHSWEQDWYGTPNAEVMLNVVDPLSNYAFEVHQYLDGDSSGSTSEIINQNIGRDRLIGFTNWLKDNNLRGYLGEFAAANSTIGNGGNRIGDETIARMLNYLESNDDVWMGWNWWAAGPWWGDYLFTLEPSNGQDRPAMDLLEQWLTDGQVDLPGDYDGNGFVDASDFTVWRDNLGTDTLLPGDTTPGDVSQQDLQVWRDFFGTERLPYSGPTAVVPEPNAMALAGIGWLLMFAMRRRRR